MKYTRTVWNFSITYLFTMFFAVHMWSKCFVCPRNYRRANCDKLSLSKDPGDLEFNLSVNLNNWLEPQVFMETTKKSDICKKRKKNASNIFKKRREQQEESQGQKISSQRLRQTGCLKDKCQGAKLITEWMDEI